MAERATPQEPGAGVLIVEDDPRIAAVLVKGLAKQGHNAESVSTGSDALARIEAGGVDLLLLDLGLPDIDGLDVLRVLRDRGISLPAIVITSRSDPRDRAAALDLGVRDYIMKPFAWSDVWAAVDRSGVTLDHD
jgi:two-component system response regulator QseB